MRLHVTEAGTGPAVVLMHGLFGMGRNLGMVQRALAQRFRVLSLDLRNHGGSPHDPDMRYDSMAEDVFETLTALGTTPAAVIGHSMGGKTAMRLALRHPAVVGRLCVADIAPVPYPPRNGPVLAALRSVPLEAGLTRAQADAAMAEGVPDPSLRAFLMQNLMFAPTPSWRIPLDAIEAALPDLEGWEPTPGLAYAGPTLFVSGVRSDFVKPGDRDTIRALFPAARFVGVKNAGHWLHVDNPQGFLAVLEAFLREWG